METQSRCSLLPPAAVENFREAGHHCVLVLQTHHIWVCALLVQTIRQLMAYRHFTRLYVAAPQSEEMYFSCCSESKDSEYCLSSLLTHTRHNMDFTSRMWRWGKRKTVSFYLRDTIRKKYFTSPFLELAFCSAHASVNLTPRPFQGNNLYNISLAQCSCCRTKHLPLLQNLQIASGNFLERLIQLPEKLS